MWEEVKNKLFLRIRFEFFKLFFEPESEQLHCYKKSTETIAMHGICQ